MKAFTNCPICNAPLMNNFQEIRFRTILTKSCNVKLDHNFSFEVQMDDGQDTIKYMSLKWDRKSQEIIVWWPDKKECNVWKRDDLGNTASRIYLPYFQPDFYHYQDLIAKIQLYIIFS